MSAQASAAGEGSLRSEHVQYLPGGDPRAIRQAAVRDPETGKIFEGYAHFAARQDAIGNGVKPQELVGYEDGFVTNSGEFLNRKEAFKRAVELKQYAPKPTAPNNYNDVLKSLEATSFETQKKLREQGYDPAVIQYAPGENLGAKEFDAELKKIREGKADGQTFTPEGLPWTAPKEPTDIVTLASVNVPLGKLTRETVQEAIKPYADLLDEPNVVMGTFSFSHEGKPTASIDINAVVPQTHRENSLKFAKDNDQVAIWDAAKNETVSSGGKGNTKLKSLGEIMDALDLLRSGEEVDVPEIVRQNRDLGPAEEQALLGGMGGTREPLSTQAQSNMTKAELAAHFPESVKPRRRNERIDSDIVGSPLYRESKNEAQAVTNFARKLVDFANEYKDHPVFKSGLKWYSDFAPRLKKEFGKHAPMMAELLAATSPRNNPTVNYAYSLDAIEGFKAGRYDKQITKFNEGWEMAKSNKWQSWFAKNVKTGENPTEAAFMAHWIKKHNLSPRQSNGAKFGMNSVAVLKTLAGTWMESVEGPKVSNFVQNLLGTGHGATIDVWANRTMRRVGYSGHVERWRILPKNEAAVTDVDFHFAQKAFAEAAKTLGVEPDALQGALWFAEKQLWADRGYARLDLGSFVTELEKTPLLKQGIAQRLAKSKQAAKAKTAAQAELFVTPRPEK